MLPIALNAELCAIPELIRPAYNHFLKPGRILLTGHSHQAWPDAVRDALLNVFDDAARYVDDKWGQCIFPKMHWVGSAVLERLGFDRDDPIAFGKSTHELLFRLLTCLPSPSRKPRIVTTTSEFHSLRRQFGRIAEEGADIVWVDAHPREALCDRLLDALVPGTAMLAISSVLFEDSYVLPRLEEILMRAIEVGAIPLVDAYHAFNVLPCRWGAAKEHVYVTAGGYKYAEFGEGLCFLRFPKQCSLRPVYTGWFADFASLAGQKPAVIRYGEGGARFSGATFDPTPFYRAEAVLKHFDRFGLNVDRLRDVSVYQCNKIIDQIDKAGMAECVVSARNADLRGGFVTLKTDRAGEVCDELRKEDVFVDSRGNLLRLGPAPYVLDSEIERGVEAVLKVIQRVGEDPGGF